MSKKLIKIAYHLRHLPILERSTWLWNLLRKPYHKLLNIKGKGVKMTINNLDITLLPE